MPLTNCCYGLRAHYAAGITCCSTTIIIVMSCRSDLRSGFLAIRTTSVCSFHPGQGDIENAPDKGVELNASNEDITHINSNLDANDKLNSMDKLEVTITVIIISVLMVYVERDNEGEISEHGDLQVS